jgi:hypothetical protein
MKFVFRRFIDCFVFWVIGVFNYGDHDDMGSFWTLLSVNATSEDYCLFYTTIIFPKDEYFPSIWRLYLDKAFKEFYEDVLVNYEDD